jgi:hypothetical protein
MRDADHIRGMTSRRRAGVIGKPNDDCAGEGGG